ncbi:uncharacterized protein [Garra rufa]|uniref:uncharacterized protein n=1 Tax=Garra rufa TaxID=137080 RepID=UPI003CCEABCC
MTLTVSQGEGLTVITVTSNPKSKWPVLCEILGFLCYNPVCSVSQGMQGKLKDLLTALGIVQMCIGVLNIAVGILFTCARFYFSMYATAQGPFWLGSVLLLSGIVCILAVKFPTSSLLVITVILNVVSAALAITAAVLYSIDLAMGSSLSCYREHNYYYAPNKYWFPSQKSNFESCFYHKSLSEAILGGLDIMMVVLSVLQLCVTISFCVLTGKALCKKDDDKRLVWDPELYKPLLEDDTADAA